MLDSKCYNFLCMYKRLLRLTVLYQLLLDLNHYAMIITTYEFMNIKSDHIGQYQASRYLLVYYLETGTIWETSLVKCVITTGCRVCWQKVMQCVER